MLRQKERTDEGRGEGGEGRQEVRQSGSDFITTLRICAAMMALGSS